MLLSRVAGRLMLMGVALLLLLLGGARLLADPNTRVVTFLRGDEHVGLYAHDLSRNLTLPIIVGRDFDVIAYEWSPDGRKLAIITLPYQRAGSGGRDMWVYRPDGPPIAMLNLVSSRGPYWTPDSRAVVQVYSDRLNLLYVDGVPDRRQVTVEGVTDMDSAYYIPVGPDEVLLRGRPVEEPQRLRFLRVNLLTGAVTPAAGLPCDGNPREIAPAPGENPTRIYGCFSEGMLYIDDPTRSLDEFPPPLVLLSELGGLGDEVGPRWSPDGELVMFTYYPTFTRPGEPPYRVYYAAPDGSGLTEIDAARGARAVDWLPPVAR